MSANDTSHVSGHLHVSPESKEPYARRSSRDSTPTPPRSSRAIRRSARR